MIPIHFGGYQPERSVHTRAVRGLAAALGPSSATGIDFRFTANIAAEGHQVADLLSLTEAGDLDLCYFASSYLADRVPELSLLDLPFPGVDRGRIWARLEGPAGVRLREAVARQTGYAVLGFWDNGIRHVSNRLRPIRHPRDCVGLSIRTLDNRFHQAMFAAMGFAPRFLDVKDLGPAVVSGTIDAQENPLTNIVNFDIQKTHRHVSLLGQFFGVALLLVNRERLEGWPAPVRTAVEAAAAAATSAQRAMAAEEDAQCLDLLSNEGVAIVAADEIEMAAFRSVVAPIVAAKTASLDPALLALWAG